MQQEPDPALPSQASLRHFLRYSLARQKSFTMRTHDAKTLAMRCRDGGHSAPEVILVDVSDIFFSCLGRGKGEFEAPGVRVGGSLF